MFRSLKELINTLSWAKDLLVEMFEKRKSLPYKYDHALELLEQPKVDSLIEKNFIRINGPYIEIDDQLVEFFEIILEVNEEINTAYIHENIELIKQNINYYLQENSETRKYSYLKYIKSTLRKIGRSIIRNVVDLNRNIDNTFKTEPNYKIKISKLQNYDRKREDIYTLITQTQKLVTEEERTFFSVALDDELKQVVVQLRHFLNESKHNLVEVQQQIIDYLNRTKYQSEVLEKIRQVKYLKDQFELKSKTNFEAVVAHDNAVIYEPKPVYPLKVSIAQLQHDDYYDIVLKVSKRAKTAVKATLPVAGNIALNDLQVETEEEVIVHYEEIKNSFLASGHNLFGFLMQYSYPRELSFGEKVTLYCQMVSLYEKELNITENFQTWENIEYALVFPK